jgi:hypothetical protein
VFTRVQEMSPDFFSSRDSGCIDAVERLVIAGVIGVVLSGVLAFAAFVAVRSRTVSGGGARSRGRCCGTRRCWCWTS